MAGRFTFYQRASNAQAPVSGVEKGQVQPGIPSRTVGVAKLPELISARVQLHQALIDRINISTLESVPREELKEQLLPTVRQYLRDSQLPLNANEIDSLIDGIVNEMLGLGPIEPLLDDSSISDILIVGPNTVYVERFGQLELTEVRFKDEEHLLRIIHRIVARMGRRVDEANPMVDARLADGSRVNIAIRPAAVDGPQVSIRKFSRNPMKLSTLVAKGAMSETMASFLAAAVEAKVSVVVSGGTGSGKTTLLNALSNYIPHTERLITIEDAAELQLQQPHVVRMETRPATLEGKLAIKQRDLVINALRMRPDRIIIGEVRGEEAFDMLQAMNTGHEGSLTTIHANTPRDAITRVAQMVNMAGMPISERTIREQIAAALHLVVQVSRLRDGSRRVMSISEITGMEGQTIQLQELMHFQQHGFDSQNKIVGQFYSLGIRPQCMSLIDGAGLSLPAHLFDPQVDSQG